VESRIKQAEAFNSTVDDSILVASDAVGMGLNLNIRRVLFDSMAKFDGEQVRPISAAQIRQIAGRAGRFGCNSSNSGLVTTIKRSDIGALKEALGQVPEAYSHAYLAPEDEQLSNLYDEIRRTYPATKNTFSATLDAFTLFSSTDGSLFKISDFRVMKKTLNLVEGIDFDGVPLSDAFAFLSAPVKPENSFMASYYMHFARNFTKGVPTPFDILPPPKAVVNSTSYKSNNWMLLEALESRHRTAELYLWLNTRFPDHFPNRKEAESYSNHLIDLITNCLSQ
jgi:ATP-dependent RNA helicase SUPV3L1/SUV3